MMDLLAEEYIKRASTWNKKLQNYNNLHNETEPVKSPVT
jgi:hypothetical protein